MPVGVRDARWNGTIVELAVLFWAEWRARTIKPFCPSRTEHRQFPVLLRNTDVSGSLSPHSLTHLLQEH
jgi:hypothetical protein